MEANKNQGSTMRVKCPKCSSVYNIPNEKIGEKPQRLRCAKCGNVFAVRRRVSKAPPPGYADFSERSSHIPDEFSFLEKGDPKDGSDAPLKSETASKVRAAPPRREAQPAAAEVRAAPPRREAQPAAAEVRAETPESVSQPAPDIYGWSPPAQSGSTPPEAADSLPKKSNSGWMATIAILVLLGAAAAFVAYRSNWKISLSKLPEQIAFAFFGGPAEKRPEEVEDLDVVIKERRVLIGDGKQPYLVATGELFNNASSARTHIVLRGRIIDEKGSVCGEVRCPCGRILDDSEIKAVSKGKLRSLYQKDGAMYNCIVDAESSTTFTLAFDDIPDDYDPSYTVEVQALSARYPKM